MRSKTILGENIFQLRQDRSWNQAALASKLGVSRAAVSQYELGDTAPSRKKMEAVAAVFNVESSLLEKRVLSRADIAAIKAGTSLPEAPELLPAAVERESYLAVQACNGTELGTLVSYYLDLGYVLRGPMLLGSETVEGEQRAVLVQNLIDPARVKNTP